MYRVENALAAALVLTLAVVMPAGAQDGDASLRPTGPVKINANNAEWEKGGAMVYTGNVRLESGDLKLKGDRLHLKQFDDGQFQATVDGAPATLDHAGLAQAGSDGERPPVSATAKQLTYDSRNDIVEIAGNALLTRGTDKIRGDSIRYDVIKRRIQAAGGEGGQVQIEIQPPPPRKEGSGLPAPKTPVSGTTRP